MKKIYNFAALVVLAAVLGAATGALLSSKLKASAQAGSAPQVAAETQPKPQTQTKNTKQSPSYKYVAQSGDSYTKMARKAVQTYGVKNKVKLSEADIIFVETNLTQLAGSPLLNEGQNVEISESIVKQWVEKAPTLTPAQEQAWNYYVQFVDFNTNSVGVAK